MARAVLIAALVLCAAAALAHAGRVMQHEEEDQVLALGFEAGPWLQAPAEAPSPYAGGVAARGAGGGGFGDAIVNVMWFLMKWANDAYAAAGRPTDQ